MARLTKWEGRDENGPRAVMIDRDSPFCEAFQNILRKLARYEDAEESLNASLEQSYETFIETAKRVVTVRAYDKLDKICSNYIHEYCPEQRTDGCPNAEKCGMFTPLRRKKTYEE